MPSLEEIKTIKKAQWYWAHRRQFHYLFIGVLLILDLVLFGIYFVQDNRYANSDSFEKINASLAKEQIDYPFFHELLGPQDLIVNQESVIRSGENYDFLALVENPNPNWQVKEIQYFFDYGSGQTDTGVTFILPDSEKYLYYTSLSEENASFPSLSSVGLVISDIFWQRIREEKDFALLSENPLLAFKYSDLRLERVAEQNQRVTQLAFQLENPTVYNFWEVPLIIVPYQGSQPMALGILPVRYLKTQEKRTIEYLWPYILPSTSRVDIRPDLNILDPSVFIPQN